MLRNSFEARYNKSFISVVYYVILTVFGTAVGTVALVSGGGVLEISAQQVICCVPSLWFMLVSWLVPLCFTVFLSRFKRMYLLHILIVVKIALFSFRGVGGFIH